MTMSMMTETVSVQLAWVRTLAFLCPTSTDTATLTLLGFVELPANMQTLPKIWNVVTADSTTTSTTAECMLGTAMQTNRWIGLVLLREVVLQRDLLTPVRVARQTITQQLRFS